MLNVTEMDEVTRVYPMGYHQHGADVVAMHTKHVKADICVTLYDTWVYDARQMQSVRWVPWMPVDHEPLPVRVKAAIESAWQPICYSKFGQRMVQEAGLEAEYVPHGIEMDVFKPTPKQATRDKLEGRLKEADFVAVMVAANKGTPSRKSFPEALLAWKRFVEKHENSVLYMHTHPGTEMSGLDLLLLIQEIGIPDDAVRFCDSYWNILGFPDNYMQTIYASADVLLNPAQGEGFGIPVVEAQACGCPVIVTDCTSMSELCFAGWKVEGQRFWTPIGAFQFIPNIDQIYDALENAWDERDNKALRKKARHGVYPAYDADYVTDHYWKPVLAKIAEEVEAAGELEPMHASGLL